jgi:hypothetical protein
MTDTTIISGLITLFTSLESFGAQDVVVDDYSILDGTSHRSPFLLIETPSDFTATQATKIPTTIWDIPVTLFVRFTDWQESMEMFRQYRNELISLMNTGTGERAAGLTTGSITIDTIKGEGNIEGFYDVYLDEEQVKSALPIYLQQTIVFTAEEY